MPEPDDTSRASESVEPGALSLLLEELARAPGVGHWDVALRPGSVLGRFEIVRELGRGGFGVVYEARDRELGRSVALKAIRTTAQPDGRDERLVHEAETAARLAHPNIVHLYDVGRCEHGPYLVLELLRGETLQARLERGPTPTAEALRIVHEVAKGVAHAHEAGVVHRDLKPPNVFLCRDGQVKVLDFGVAHAFGRRRIDGGTPGYMAPEQQRGAPEDERTDVYALGLILYRLLAGRSPFDASARPDDRCVAPALEVEGAPGLGELLARMLDPDPVNRPRDAGEVVRALAAPLRDLDARGSSPSVTVRARRSWSARRRAAVAVGAVVILAATFGVLRSSLRGAARERLAVAPISGEGRAIVAVADVANATGERDLDSVGGLLVTAMEQSRRLAVLSPDRLRELARESGHPAGDHVDQRVAAEVGRRARATALLAASVRRLGSAYALEARVTDPADGRVLFSTTERARTKEDLLPAIDTVSDRVRRELGEPAVDVASARVQVGAAMTRSLEAYRHYAAGVARHLRDCDDDAAEREHRAALELDPDFAAAHLELASLIQFRDRRDRAEASAHYRAAYALADRMPDKERRLVQLDPFVTPSQMDEAERRARSGEALRMADELAVRYPYDAFALYYAGVAHLYLGTRERTIDLLQRSLRLDPGQCSVVTQILPLLNAAGRPGEALAVARAAAAANPAPWNAGQLALASLWTGARDDAAARAREALRARSRDPSPACVLAATGGAVEAELALRHVAEAVTSEQRRLVARQFAVAMVAHQGRVRDARREWQSIIPEYSQMDERTPLAWMAALHTVGRSGPTPEAIEPLRRTPPSFATAALLVLFGASEEAGNIAAGLTRGAPGEAAYVAARLAAEGPPERAIDALRAVDEKSIPGGRWIRRVLLGETLLATGRPADAIDALRDIELTAEFCGALSAALYPRALLARSRALDALGRRPEALAEVDRLLTRWKRADPDLPLLADARALRRRLAAR